MSRDAVIDVLDRALLDETFRHRIETDGAEALIDYNLTPQERAIVLSRNVATMDEFFPGVLYCTLRFAMINENIVAVEPFPDEFRRAELQRRGQLLVESTGDRTQPLKDMLRLFRQA